MDTLDEVREILKKIGISQAKTDEQLARTDQQLAQNSKDIAELRRSQARTDEQLLELRRSQEKTDAQMARTDAQLARSWAENDKQMAKLSKNIDSIGSQLANIGFNNGDFAEELFFNSLYANPFLGGLRYDSVKRNVSNRRRNRDEGEYDIVMYNGDTVALIEVKYKAHINDIDELLTKEPQNFRKTFTEYKDYKFYLGLASTVTYDKLITEAREAGIFLLTQRGQHIEIVNEEVHSF